MAVLPKLGRGREKVGAEPKGVDANGKDILLPSKEDRKRMYLCVLAAASSFIGKTTADAGPSSSSIFESNQFDGGLSSMTSMDSMSSEQEGITSVRSAESTASAASSPMNRFRMSEKEKLARHRYETRIRTVLQEDLPDLTAKSLMIPPPSGDFTQIVERKVPLPLPEDGTRCVALLLFNMILLSSGDGGYDSRIRHTIKTASVHILYKQMTSAEPPGSSIHISDSDVSDAGDAAADSDAEDDPWSSTKQYGHSWSTDQYQKYEKASQQFDAMEALVAQTLAQLLLSSGSRLGSKNGANEEKTRQSSSKLKIARGLKIGAAGVAAGTLLAVTGGMAAPAIAAGVAALGLGTTAAIITLTSHAVLVAMFGLGGGGLAAYKMKRRTDGLKEFRIRKENSHGDDSTEPNSKLPDPTRAQLRSTVCVSGWLSDKCDFQRPWGFTPTDPAITELELLQRFVSVHCPEKLPKCERILKKYEGMKEHLWAFLQEAYGADPDSLLPLKGVKHDIKSEDEQLIEEMALLLTKKVAPKKKKSAKPKATEPTSGEERSPKLFWEIIEDGLEEESELKESEHSSSKECSIEDDGLLTVDDEDYLVENNKQSPTEIPENIDNVYTFKSKKSQRVVWDYQSQYGGDVYTVTWESELLLELGNIVKDIAEEGTKAGMSVLVQTAVVTIGTVMATVALPVTILGYAGAIDGPWTMATIRADKAGKELARSLLSSEDRHPVTLVGYSNGGRVIFSCLQTLARYQEEWENNRDKSNEKPSTPIVSTEDTEAPVQRDRTSSKLFEDDENCKFKFTREPASVIEDAIIIGAPCFINRAHWTACRQVVGGRLINCYSKKDWILSVLFQYKSKSGIMRATCGTSPVKGVAGVENYDISYIVSSHNMYCGKVPEILKLVSFGQPEAIMNDPKNDAIEMYTNELL
mmetsp:Transcript_7058/g.12658  ORF Transcript_7058/g.12658 Transcript_7058/m.12658 type:complete len:921 (-) Transcript_7058:126-2888(-)|eukprot:CAMPEP_0198286348 /NCGR_PEP_ID=MMETSP1449-20131203/5452_1 /TAXON_ID=420275 /ORGANISM="Attheya septentrionalis, Strain CCMP2084" /LENGTH=920 /DNA_ID=CAMNT_0043984063 /DNA_START=78 /DNA_END=2840 /DNA_ORIENTATION=+